MENTGQIKGSNQLNKGNDVRLTYTADNNLAAALTTLYLLPGVGDAAAKTLPAGISIGGDYGSVADLTDYFENVVCAMSELRIETNDTNNFENTTLVIGERNPNRQNPVEKRFYMTNYQVSTGNGIKKSVLLTKDDFGNGAAIILTPQTYIRFEGLRKNSVITPYLKIAGVLRSYTLDEASF